MCGLNKSTRCPKIISPLTSAIEISPNGFRPIKKPKQTKPFNSKQKNNGYHTVE